MEIDNKKTKANFKIKVSNDRFLKMNNEKTELKSSIREAKKITRKGYNLEQVTGIEPV